MSLPTNEPPPKYSQAYFEERIKSLQTKIKNVVPSQEDLIKNENNIFPTVLSALESAKGNLDTTNGLQKLVLKEQKEHSDDDGYALLLDPLKEAIQEGQSCVQDLERAATKAATAIVKDSGLVHEARSLLQIQDILLECTVLIQATPKKLADWCALSSPKNGELLDAFFANDDGSGLMASFLREGGPSHGNYGPALTIYDQLQNELHNNDCRNQKSTQDALALKHRLALAVALEHATEVQIFKQDTFVNPLERFRYFAKFADRNSSDDDKLDEAFYDLSVWELRKVVDANATHEDLTWGRKYLRNYRPDEITTNNLKWRYVQSVRTDIGYRHPDHEFENYQQLLSAGGECGPRAFFGRFISKAFGIPTWGCRQPGHAAMTRYTQDSGWVVCLGAGWPYSWWDDDRYCGAGQNRTRHGPDFLEETQARGSVDRSVYYRQVVLMECLAEIQGETVEEDFRASKFWRSLALGQRKELAKDFLTEKNVVDFNSTTKNEYSNDRNSSLSIRHLEDGTIVIPAASFVNPKKTSNNVMILESFLGGQQLHLEHNGAVEYEFLNSVEAGTYELSATVCNVHQNQKPLLVEVENYSIDSDDGYEIIQLPQITICWYVDDLKISCVHEKEVMQVIDALEARYGAMKKSLGDKHSYLGMDVEFCKDDGTVKISMEHHLKDAIATFGEDLGAAPATPASGSCFETDPNSSPLPESKRKIFHSIVQKLLYVSKRARPDLLPTVAFLTRRVTKATEQDWGKLRRGLCYTKHTLHMPLILSIDDLTIVKNWVDAAFGIHDDFKSHTGFSRFSFKSKYIATFFSFFCVSSLG